MTIAVEVDQTPDGKYFFKTEEKQMFCPECKRKYKRRKLCLHCLKNKGEKIETKQTTTTREGWITEDLHKYSCDCVFSSWHKWGGHWQKNYPKTRCKHCKWAMKQIKNDKKELQGLRN